jgi:ACS family tartrate transporter-like MFS transporter
VYFGTSAGLYTLGIWSPQIIKSFGLSTFEVGFVNALPAIIAVLAMVWWAANSDRTGERTWHVVIACLFAAGGLVLAGFAGSVGAAIAALTIVNMGVSCSKPPLWSMPTMFLSGTAAATGIATINSIGNLGGFAGPAMIGWIKDLTGSFAGGLYFVAGLLTLSAIITLVLSRTGRKPVAVDEASSSVQSQARI